MAFALFAMYQNAIINEIGDGIMWGLRERVSRRVSNFFFLQNMCKN
jgi:hypothetical protein